MTLWMENTHLSWKGWGLLSITPGVPRLSYTFINWASPWYNQMLPTSCNKWKPVCSSLSFLSRDLGGWSQRILNQDWALGILFQEPCVWASLYLSPWAGKMMFSSFSLTLVKSFRHCLHPLLFSSSFCLSFFFNSSAIYYNFPSLPSPSLYPSYSLSLRKEKTPQGHQSNMA